MKTDNILKFKTQKILSLLTLAFGFVVLLYGIIVENEPTFVALLLIVVGTGWYFITRYRIKMHGE